MFEKIRKPGRGKAMVAYIVFGAICLVFIFLGMAPQGTGFVGGGAAAIVNDEVISQKDYRERVRRAESQMGMNLNQFPAAQRKMFTTQIRQRALEELIQMELLAQAAHAEGLFTSDEQVRDYILEIPLFQEKGRFQRVRYDTYLKNTKTTAGQFETMVRRDLSRQRVRDVFIKALSPASLAVEKDRLAKGTKAAISFISFSKTDLKAKMKPNSKEKKEFASSEAGEGKIRQYYKDNKSKFSSPKQVKVSHILINAKRGDKSAEETALKKINDLQSQVKSGDFALIAKANSQDTVSAKKNGELGWVKPGQMVKEFEDAAFSLKVGEVSEPVQSQFGFHLIKVSEAKKAEEKSLEEVKDEIIQVVMAESLVDGVLEKLRGDLKEAKKLTWFTKRFSMKWQETGDFAINATSPKLSDEKVIGEVLDAAKVGTVMDSLIESNGSYYIAKLEKVTWPEDNGSSNIEVLASRRAGDALSTWIKAIEKTAIIQRNPALLR